MIFNPVSSGYVDTMIQFKLSVLLNQSMLIVVSVFGFLSVSLAENSEELIYPISYKIEKVWEHLITDESPALPILKGKHPQKFSADVYNGRALFDTYTGFKYYGSGKGLLGIRENGIDEQAADHDVEMASTYPDRSLVWIDLQNGQPMGVAIDVGLNPVTLDEESIQAGLNGITRFMEFAVGPDGSVYVGYFTKILKYEPLEDGTFRDPMEIIDIKESYNIGEAGEIETLRSSDDLLFMWIPNYRSVFVIKLFEDSAPENHDVFAFNLGNDLGGISQLIEADGDFGNEFYIFTADPVMRFISLSSRNGSPSNFEPDFSFMDLDPATAFDVDPIIGLSPIDSLPSTQGIDVSRSHGLTVEYSAPTDLLMIRSPDFDFTLPGRIRLRDEKYEVLNEYSLAVREADELSDAVENPEFHPYGLKGNIDFTELSGSLFPRQMSFLWGSGVYGYGYYKFVRQPVPQVLTLSKVSEGLKISWQVQGSGPINLSANVDPSLEFDVEYILQSTTDPIDSDWVDIKTISTHSWSPEDQVMSVIIDPQESQEFYRALFREKDPLGGI